MAIISHEASANKNKVVAIVGMAGAGKSEVARVFEQEGFKKIRFGDITDEEIRKRGLELNEDNERMVREELRIEYGMAAYAAMNIPKIENMMESHNVVVDGLYSWAEYELMKEKFGDRFVVLAVWSSPNTRYRRLMNRQTRRLTREEAEMRDKTEIENSDKGGPIAMADYTIINEASLDDLRNETRKLLIKWK